MDEIQKQYIESLSGYQLVGLLDSTWRMYSKGEIPKQVFDERRAGILKIAVERATQKVEAQL